MSTRVAWRLGDALRRRVPVTLFISVVLLLSVVATAVAAQGSNSVEITLEGEALQTPGIVVEGRTVVPLEPLERKSASMWPFTRLMTRSPWLRMTGGSPCRRDVPSPW